MALTPCLAHPPSLGHLDRPFFVFSLMPLPPRLPPPPLLSPVPLLPLLRLLPLPLRTPSPLPTYPSLLPPPPLDPRCRCRRCLLPPRSLDVVMALLRGRARRDVNKTTRGSRQTPLFCAVTHGHADVALALVRAGGDVDLADAHGETTSCFCSIFFLAFVERGL